MLAILYADPSHHLVLFSDFITFPIVKGSEKVYPKLSFWCFSPSGGVLVLKGLKEWSEQKVIIYRQNTHIHNWGNTLTLVVRDLKATEIFLRWKICLMKLCVSLKETCVILKSVHGVSGRIVRNPQLISSISAETGLVENYLVKEVI